MADTSEREACSHALSGALKRGGIRGRELAAALGLDPSAVTRRETQYRATSSELRSNEINTANGFLRAYQAKLANR
jgi:hypothetical protein